MITTLGSTMQYPGMQPVSGVRPPAAMGEVDATRSATSGPTARAESRAPETPVRAQHDVRGMFVDRYA